MTNKIFAQLCIGLILFSCENNNTEIPVACFTYKSSFNGTNSPLPVVDTIWFENCSTNATSYLWNFGDGTTSEEVNPMHIYNQSMPTIVSLKAFNGENTDELTDTIFDWSIVYKPNIYLYPKENTSICVSISFPKGGEIIASIPEYQNGWCVNVNPEGKIENEYDYLFYESTQPNIWQRNKGWCIEKSKLEAFFKADMKSRGFAQNEMDDFIEYWIPRMKEFPYYTIFPQTKEAINLVVDVEFSVQPDTFYRLFYCIKGSQKSLTLDEPVNSTFTRNGFTALEWGVVMR